ncbi:hypothetical protein Cflav_PD4946 [Pedosphaera parvula Ellin514]|uniref:Uncharacterized protein n=1 Tax=Pedosphaera parvula (strain Ellin514) TaxID=320771 RepID=B9XCW5_PEDPL|nr:hypothetical protein Cflav_PD4946 [Pedosphaera parvula Ellin514]
MMLTFFQPAQSEAEQDGAIPPLPKHLHLQDFNSCTLANTRVTRPAPRASTSLQAQTKNSFKLKHMWKLET